MYILVRTPRRAIFWTEEKCQTMYEYQGLVFMRGRVRRQRDTLSTGLFRNCEISSRIWNEQTRHLSPTNTPTVYRRARSLPAKENAHTLHPEKNLREKLDANISWTPD